MEESEVLAYVKAAAQAAGLPLGEVRTRAVAEHFGRTLALARALDAAELAPEHELAEVYCPAPFPDSGGERA